MKKICFMMSLLTAFLLTVTGAAATESQPDKLTVSFYEFVEVPEPPLARVLADDAWEDDWTCYGDQLTDDAKMIYEMYESSFADDNVPLVEINSKLCWIKERTYSLPCTRDTFENVVDAWYAEMRTQAMVACEAFSYDHPEYFWIRQARSVGYSAGYSGTSSNGVARITLRAGFIAQPTCNTIEKRDALQEQITPVIEQLLRETENMGTVARLAYFDNWLAANNQYNHTAANTANYIETDDTPWNIAGALLEEYSPVCEGYAKTFQLLCHKLGVPCVTICSSNHMWTAVKLDGRWFLCDPTWNDPSDGAGGDWSISARSYFLQAATTAHTASMELIIPDVEEVDYLDFSRTGTVSDGIFGGGLFIGEQVYWVALYSRSGKMIAVKPCESFVWKPGLMACAAPHFTPEELASAVTAKLFGVENWLPTTAASPLGSAAD